MDEITSTTNQRPAPRRSRVSKSTMPNIPTFGGEFQREEPTYNLDDVLLSGSDDEYYDSPNERSRRLEEQARLFLQGHRPLLLSASLRGPFGRETGWENPWIGRRSKITKTGTSHCSASLRAPLASTSEVGVAARTRTATTRRSSISGSSAKGLTINDLRAAPDITYTDKDPEVKKRAAGADWLRRRNFKRMRPNDDDVTASPTPTRSSKTTVIPSVASSPKKSALSRSVSAPVSRTASSSDQDVATAATPSDGVATESNVKSQPSHIAEDMNQSVSHISDSEVAMSLPSDLLWASNPGAEQPSPQDEKTSEDEGYVQSDPDTTTPIRDKSTTTIGDDTTLFSAEDELTSEVDAESSLLMECPAVDNEPSANIEDGDDDMQQNVEPVVICEDEAERITSHADNIATDAFATDADAVETEAMPASLDDTEMENDRLETQYQSPWAKTQTSVMTGLMVSDVGSTVSRIPGSHSKDVQSPWSRETQSQLPNIEAGSGAKAEAVQDFLVGSNRPSLSLSQTPWADSNPATSSFSSSLSNLPTSPCSPRKDDTALLPRNKNDHDQDDEQFLASLPIPIPAANSSGTAPSTPDTKQSSLPTPDMTVSIKSFRRFRSPTPTPLPRRQSAKSSGPRSILSHPRRRSGAVKSASKSGHRVHFSLPHDEDTALEDGSASLEGPDHQRAASPPPQDKTLVESLPTEVDRFKGHFATIAGRAGGQPTATSAVPRPNAKRLSELETSPVNVYTSLSVSAMATRYQDADEDVARLRQITSAQSQQSPALPRLHQGSSDTSNKSLSMRGGDNKENDTLGRGDDQLEADGGDDDFGPAAADDDVQDVMDNLDDFLNLWDMDAELAQSH